MTCINPNWLILARGEVIWSFTKIQSSFVLLLQNYHWRYGHLIVTLFPSLFAVRCNNWAKLCMTTLGLNRKTVVVYCPYLSTTLKMGSRKFNLIHQIRLRPCEIAEQQSGKDLGFWMNTWSRASFTKLDLLHSTDMRKINSYFP